MSMPGLGLKRLVSCRRQLSYIHRFNGISPYYREFVFDLREGTNYSTMPDVALYLAYIARWNEGLSIVIGPPSRIEVETGRKYLESQLAKNQGLFASTPQSSTQMVPASLSDDVQPVWAKIVANKQFQEVVRDKEDDISSGYYIDRNCLLANEEQHEQLVKTNIRIPFPYTVQNTLSERDFQHAIAHMYDPGINPVWRYLEALDIGETWQKSEERLENMFIRAQLGLKPQESDSATTQIRAQEKKWKPYNQLATLKNTLSLPESQETPGLK